MVSQSSSGDNGIPNGWISAASTWGEFNKMSFLVQQALDQMQTATLVRVESCSNDGGMAAVGTVAVTPMVYQIDGRGDATPHGVIFNIPYFRLQGGSNGIIIDPKKGDIGIAVFASRDISQVKENKVPSPPGSFRKYSFSDGLYLGGVLNGVPEQYVQFTNDGIIIKSPDMIKLEAPEIRIESERVEINASTSATITTPTFKVSGDIQLEGNLTQTGGSASTFSGDVSAQGVSLATHQHTSSNSGTPTSPPIP